jgi:neutral ceramidase
MVTPTIRRAFTTVTLPGNDGLCGHPLIGSAAAAGAEALVTRVRGWDWVVWPFFRMGMEEGGGGAQRAKGCHDTKRPLQRPIQKRLLVGEHGFPEVAQLAAVQIGPLLLVAVPAELTTVTWRSIQERLVELSRPAGVEHVALIGLANGYLQYVTTAKEYELQHYEGGSTLYGPGMAGFLERRLVELVTGMLRTPADAPQVLPLMAHPGADEELARRTSKSP